ncbi:MAG TPA: VWA domain-containing protein [Bryobacteraceae bacterium]|nr:VWA domain-containing protein [Bryobacteraceae bacterium]
MRSLRIFGALVGVAALGQQPAPRPPAQPAAPSGPAVKFSANSNLVIVDVTVKDKAGKAIENLKSNDFTLLEDGKQQKISVFEFQKLALDPEPPAPPPSLGDEKELPEDPKTTITSEAPGKVQYHDKRLLVLFFDFSNMGIPEELRAQEAALKYLDTQMTGSDLMAIMLFTSVVQVKTDFTADRMVLKDVINSLPIGELADLADQADTGDDNEEDTGAAFVADETEFNIFNTDRKLAAIEDAVHKLASLSEKKVLIYVTGGISKTGIDNQAQLEASINAAVKSNVSIYPIDARGLMADPPGGGASKGASRGTGIFNGSVYNSQRASINNSQETLATLASDTGGKVFLDSNDLSLGIVQAQQDYRSYYIIGYYTDNNKEDGKWRKITVKLNGNASAKLEHRQGYYADKVWGKNTGAEKELQLQQALASPDPKTDLPLALEADYFRISPTAYYVPVSVKIPGSVIALAEKRGGGETQFDFIGQVIDERKTIVGKVRDYIKVKLDAGEAEKLARRNFHYDAGFTLAPGRYRIQFLVRENETGKMGTFDGRFIVPDLAADSALLKTSSVIWSSQREPLKAAVGAAERTARKELAANPLILGDEKIVPNVTRMFHRGQNMYVTFDVYDAAPDPADYRKRRVAVNMSLFNQKGMKAFEASPVEATELAVSRPNAVPVQLQVPLKGLAPGRYICQIDVVDQVGRKFAFPRSLVVVQ